MYDNDFIQEGYADPKWMKHNGDRLSKNQRKRKNRPELTFEQRVANKKKYEEKLTSKT